MHAREDFYEYCASGAGIQSALGSTKVIYLPDNLLYFDRQRL